MKKHAIIPIFIPHRGCPHNCVFCNQNAITARSSDITPQDARRIIEEYLPTLKNRGLEEIEVSFFGGSFTGIPMDEQSAFLAVAKEYKDSGKIDKIHLSTRPDYIDKAILDNLKKYGVDVIELGVQSFDEKVLKASARGHSRECVYEACDLIKSYGFILGIQLMIGLPEDNYESCMFSASETVKIGPQIARLYPTVVISDTPLYTMYEDGRYCPPAGEEMLKTVKDMYRLLTENGINVIRVGLKSSALINDGSDSKVAGNSYHPAFKELVLGEIFKEKLEDSLRNNADFSALLDDSGKACGGYALVLVNPEDMSVSAGHKGRNKAYFDELFGAGSVRIKQNKNVPQGEFSIETVLATPKLQKNLVNNFQLTG